MMLFILLGICLAWLIYATVTLYGITGYIAIVAVVLFLVVWTWAHRDEMAEREKSSSEL
jgi:hypothetical protein